MIIALVVSPFLLWWYTLTSLACRYIHLRGVPSLAAQLRSLVEVVSHFSYPLQPGGQLGPCPSGIDPSRQPALFQRQLRAGLETLLMPGMASGAALTPHWGR